MEIKSLKNGLDREIPKERFIFPKKRQKFINNLRLI